MQALLFGKTEMNVFGTKESRLEMLKYLKAICHIGSVLGAQRIVFGSPKNRDCTGLNELETKKIATDFFQRLGDIAESKGVIICLEPCFIDNEAACLLCLNKETSLMAIAYFLILFFVIACISNAEIEILSLIHI